MRSVQNYACIESQRKTNHCYTTAVHWCRASSNACGEGVCATTGYSPADFNASAVVGPIAATCGRMHAVGESTCTLQQTSSQETEIHRALALYVQK